ncbi:MAG: hypothetical protein JXR83_18100 [Deltaproteobacteria bacterium]|nr:hypothetical protein [Deltaproteobacteria bacterium]
MNSKRSLLSAACLVAMSCAAACGGTQKPPAREYHAVDFWPLAVGNSWTYQNSMRGVTQREVVSIVKQEDGYFIDSRGARLQHHPAGVFDGERFMLRDPIALGAKWIAVPSANSLERYEIIAIGFTTTVPAGVFENCVRVQAVNRMSQSQALILEWTYAPGVGLVQLTSRLEVDGKPPEPQVTTVLVKFEQKPDA